MSKVIKLEASGVTLADFPDDSTTVEQLQWFYSQIGCEYIETVPAWRSGGNTYQIVCDEEGKLHGMPFNPFATWIFGGESIVGTALLLKVHDTQYGPELGGMDEDEALELLRMMCDELTKEATP